MKIKLGKLGLLSIVIVSMFFFAPLQSMAADEAMNVEEIGETTGALNQVMIAQEEVEAREQPEVNAAVVETFTIGTPVLVIEVANAEWYAISHQEQTLYVPQVSLQQSVESPELEQEFQQMEEEGMMIITAVEQYRQDRIRSRIWAGVIILLVIGIFAVGVVGSIKNKREENQTGKEADRSKIENPKKEKSLNEGKAIEIIDLD